MKKWIVTLSLLIMMLAVCTTTVSADVDQVGIGYTDPGHVGGS